MFKDTDVSKDVFPDEKKKKKKKKKIGKMKDETAGMPIKEFIGLRSRLYLYSTDPKSFSKSKN